MSLFNLDPALDQPLYRQIALQVKSAVEDGSLHPGDKLPTVRELSQELATASGTVKRAYDELARQGVIEMTQGKGTFIAQPATENSRKEQAMAAISQAVVRVGADLGVIFDADCDRAAIVDHTGKEINRNRLIALISAILLDETPGATIVTDSVTSSGLSDFIREWGGEHYRYKRGYRNVIDEAVRLNKAGIDCPLAIETSGHAAFRENYYLDDGAYLVTRFLMEIAAGRSLESLLEGLREPVESREFRLKILAEDFRAAGTAVLDSLAEYAKEQPGWSIAPDNCEGVRVNLDKAHGDGWFLLRLSLHDPILPLNIESDREHGARTIARELAPFLAQQTEIDASSALDFTL